ncbi:bifunctional DNA-formamidopyrimidine glycosylase/DNA-(apurinic or apyrimidinic site) lyase [Acetobacter lambici]|uniref:Formamidopyrimidine-DNA glycosylase n=1 Tax=Acetobacter lambici TaxID=1332824 RepID=A0ABT1EVL7_9PROT|nr:bifunctional DNA-formamidopyrimidine glycosylase/DNA-(apurinic or apyrimidinic site) lyase [Acetobacter lambici]MCP1241338.1 bifunctional DNA-formamidopyrimidine glycosylase/DNA-(apurinic or apyrimidinic site) lyase [Acetobacter lambici]MCP1256992.1 bifunctional DNA-formamidopyrimidine glycosylase/DNA-(apurinic or apyrimidinic site) lyase [Acetobacter lambici]NHO55485.1 bifunctional DNA-formamidopyrimidine glycosylase/DNA-(apurinic or apyrimidinic site) lyase [Acetobacter lambici]
MPELPEVETVMRGMQIALQDRAIVQTIIRRHDLRWRIPADFSQQVTGSTIQSFYRRGKYILIRLSCGQSIILHLGMSGRVLLDSPQTPQAHEHVVFVTDDGKRCAYIDPRRFGMMDLTPTHAENTYRAFAKMGPEPLGNTFSPQTLLDACKGRRTPIKPFLLDQHVVAGLGNIYVCEALFRASIAPTMPACDLRPRAAGVLVRAIRSVLLEAIAAGGSSLKDYARPEGGLGYFQHAWQVYGKKGQPCPKCPGTPKCAGVQHMTQAGRTTFFCPQHQKNG